MKNINITHLGQTGFRIDYRDITIIIDPYLSYSVDDGDKWVRKFAPPVLPSDITDADMVFLSHDHLDHVDPETLLGIAKASPECRFAASAWYAVRRLTDIGIAEDRIIPLTADEPVVLADGITVTPIPAAHEELHPCTPGGYEELGFIIDIDGRRIYHGGDTCVYDGLSERIKGVAVAILPVNGRDEERHRMNCIGNMNAAEAAKLACDAEVELVIPSHWELYELNGETPENIRAAFGKYPDVKFILTGVCEPFEKTVTIE
ncbi:MAG: MBL fold metallo-hydrolase [Ruminococcaceae bacterium]|nr:MBL fold metallo-hydrolase [Oscillospiraceae bacterium]